MTINRRTLFLGALAGAVVPALARVAVTGVAAPGTLEKSRREASNAMAGDHDSNFA